MHGKMEKNIPQLAHHLKQEKLFIESEKSHLESLNRKLMKTIENVYQASFIRGEQRRNYNNLVLQPHSSPPACCQRSNILSQLQFIEGYQVLGYLETFFGEALSGLRENPRLCAHCLVVGETIGQETMHQAAAAVFASIYGNCILPEDELYLLLLLNNLIELQLAPSENPRRLLHHGSCAFSQVYRTYIDTLPQAKVFLTAALHEPIMQLLMEDELFLDIDPTNAAGRFPQEERRKRFGQEGTKAYEEALAKYRLWTINKLVNITNRFIESIRGAMHCFPATLAWLVRTLYEVLTNAKTLSGREISSLCVDLVFTLFICSAVVSPEPHGIVDAPISHISRFNLMQVAQILQALAINKWEDPDQRISDLYHSFDKKVLAGLFDVVIGSGVPEQPPVATSGNCPLTGLSRSSFMIPESHLISLVNFLFQVQERLPETSPSYKELSTILRPLKPHIDQFQNEKQTTHSSSNSGGVSLHNSTGTEGHNQNSNSPSSGHKKNLLNRVRSSRKSKIISNAESSLDTLDDSGGSHSSSGAVPNSTSNLSLQSQQSSSLEDKEEASQSFSYSTKYEMVLVIPLPSNTGRRECPGMMSEEKVLDSLQESKAASRGSKPASEGDRVPGVTGDGPIEKRTRFSLSHDDGSIGNTSDNLEAISEAASNHSVASSMDDVEQVDQPDNLSDMVSANVSGRGTPNVSGRDTPSSQITEGDEGGVRCSGDASRGGVSNMSGSGMTKEASADIEEKFGKFEIKPISGEAQGAGDETTSLVSDTWSTDVLASDSEIIENRVDDGDVAGGAAGGELLDRHLVELDRMHGTGGRGEFLLRGGDAPCGEASETASEAWSTDVLASDSERLTEVDTDDAQSVARSDDTGRSEVEPELVIADPAPPAPPIGHLQGKPLGAMGEDASPPMLTSSKSVESESIDGVSEGEAGFEKGPHDDGAVDGDDSPSISSSMRILKVSCEGRKGLRFAPVTQITGDIHPSINSRFEPICSPSDGDCPSQDSVNGISSRGRAPDSSEIQSLGRLSLTLSDLPNNGLVATAQPLVFNQISGKGEDACFPQKERKTDMNGLDPSEDTLTPQTTKEEGGVRPPDRKDLPEDSGGSNIHLSTTSLASSGSSESDGLPSQSAKEQNQSSQQQPLSALASSEVSPTTMHDLVSSSSASSSSFSSLASTGAIPKSISFDKTAERGDRADRDPSSSLPDGECSGGGGKHNKKGFFKVFKLPPFKGRRQKVGSGGFSSSGANRSTEDYSLTRSSLGPSDTNIRRSLSEENRGTILEESTDEILAKYRKKPEATSTSETDGKPLMMAEFSSPGVELRKGEEECPFSPAVCEMGSYAYKDAKRKLRMALSSADFSAPFYSVYFSSSDLLQDDDIIAWLKTQLAEAQNLQDRSLVAQLHETIRCLNLFDQQGRETILQNLKEDYHRRSPYIAYLIRSRQGLLNSIAHLEKLLLKLDTDTAIITTSMVNVCVRMFLEKRDEVLSQFTKNFMQLTVPDEKVELVETFLSKLYAELERDPMWISSTPEQLSLAQLSLERCIMSHIYIHALYPNGDGDVSRDQVLFEHMKKLSAVITPSHKDLRIPKHYQYECPWPSAQAELKCLGAYKTSEDKVRCVVRASKTIMNLLSMGQPTSVPSADDFIPVLVYVLIKANPPCLLSTAQYVDLFFEQRLHGEDRYWWTQFCSSIEFIKTMDYTP